MICGLGLVGGLALAGAVLGLATGVAANGFGPEGYVGAIAGTYLAFAGLGADTSVVAQAGEGGLSWAFGAVSPLALLGTGLLARTLIRGALPRTRRDAPTRRAFVAKFAVVAAILLAIVGSVVAIGDLEEGTSGPGLQVIAEVGIGEAAWWLLVTILVVGASEIERRPAIRDWAPRAGLAGAAAAAVAIVMLGLSASVVALIAADRGDERVAAAVATPFASANAGAVAHSLVVGASAETGYTTEVMDSHLSLFNWEIPRGDEDSTPPWIWPLVLLPPLLGAIVTWRHLNRARPTTGQTVLGGALLVAVGYALVSWLAALVMPLLAYGVAIDGNQDVFGRAAVARPSVLSTLGLALLSSMIGAVLAAVLWARGANVHLIAQVQPDVPGTPLAPPPPPLAATPPSPSPAAPQGAPAAQRRCPSCGKGVPAEAAFCPMCGHNADVSR